MRRSSGERGQVVPLVAVLLLVGALATTGLARLGAEAGARAQVQSLADVVALAAGDGGAGEAARVAAANQAEVVEYREAGSFVQVLVRRGSHRARATIERVPLVVDGPPAGP